MLEGVLRVSSELSVHSVCLRAPNTISSEPATQGRYLLLKSCNHQISQRKFEMAAARPSCYCPVHPSPLRILSSLLCRRFSLKLPNKSRITASVGQTAFLKSPPLGSPGWCPLFSSWQLLLCFLIHFLLSPPCSGPFLIPLLSIVLGDLTHPKALNSPLQTSTKQAFLAPAPLRRAPDLPFPPLADSEDRLHGLVTGQTLEQPLSTETRFFEQDQDDS